jgi:uncharacterized DUF497 family protein
VEITYDHAKNEKNIRERGLSFERAEEFDFGTADVRSIWRNRELRFAATGFLNGRVHVLIFIDALDGIRVISFRKANKREVRDYEEGRRNLEQRT